MSVLSYDRLDYISWGLSMSLCPFIFKDPESTSYGNDSSARPIFGDSQNVFDSISIGFGKASGYTKKLLNRMSHRFFVSKLDRVKLAQKPNLSDEQVEIILKDPSPIVRLELAWNTTVSHEILRLLIRDKDPTVSNVARRRLIKTTNEIEISGISA